jgi:hypothetical protein
MPELETALRQLGAELEFPPAPDVASTIRGRLERPRAWRRPVLIAFALLLVALGAAFAVPSARTAILDWLGLRNVSVVRVDHLPAAKSFSRVDLGSEVTLAEAKRSAPWLLVPDEQPDHVYVSEIVPGGRLTLLWGTPTAVRLLLTETTGRAYIEKVVQGDTQVERVDIGQGGAWFQGQHVVMFQDRNGVFREARARLAKSTLAWQMDDVTLRLEGEISKAEAVRIARTVR